MLHYLTTNNRKDVVAFCLEGIFYLAFHLSKLIICSYLLYVCPVYGSQNLELNVLIALPSYSLINTIHILQEFFILFTMLQHSSL